MFLHESQELYDAEHRFLKEQRELARRAANEDLRRAVREHIEQTARRIENPEQVFGKLSEELQRSDNEVAKGLISDAGEGMQNARSKEVRDCMIDAAVMKVEHFEIGVYRALSTGARLEGREEAARLLEENLNHEEEAARTVESSADTLLRKIR